MIDLTVKTLDSQNHAFSLEDDVSIFSRSHTFPTTNSCSVCVRPERYYCLQCPERCIPQLLMYQSILSFFNHVITSIIDLESRLCCPLYSTFYIVLQFTVFKQHYFLPLLTSFSRITSGIVNVCTMDS